MSINTNISLSTVSRIDNAVQHSTDGFSVVDTMGSLVNNAKFKAGYDEFAQSKHTQKSYVWEALSAIAEDFGQSLYANVKDYIDNVSNIDACKIHALKSMMHMVNVDYSVLDKIDYYPIEIQNMMDILSISKKYLLNNKHIKQDFLDAIAADGYAQRFLPSALVSSEYFMSVDGRPASLSDECMLSIGIASSDIDYYLLQSNEAFESYLSGVYNNFIYDMLTMHGTGSCSSIVLLSTGFLSSMYGPYVGIIDKYLDKKKENNIDIQFNVEQIADDIEIGNDSIENYSGPQLSLLQEEFEYRKSPDLALSALDLATRYNYYRKKKIVEYANFVDNMVFLPTNFSSYTTYRYDTNYLTMLSTAQLCLCIKDIGTTNPKIDDNAVSCAAVALAHMTQYIAKLRETLKLQVRKVFIKGTNNLLRYSANEFLIDYIDTMKSSMPESQLSVFAQYLSSHLIDDVIVQEYWDLNEYMNISSDTSQYAVNQRACNGRYFDETFSRENGTLVPTENNIFTNEDLNDFYLNTLGIANTLNPIISGANPSLLSSNFYEFLSVLFDIAADKSYYSEADGTFNAKLSNNVITEEVKGDLSSILSINQFVEDTAASSDFQFDGEIAISAQINDFAEQTYFTVRDKNLEGISSTYEQYYPIVDQLSAEMATLANDFITSITKTYACYFCKSTSLYSYETDGTYKFDYYVGDTNFLNNNCYIMSSTTAREWINDDHCYTLALSTAIESLSSTYDQCKEQIDAISESLQYLDYISPNSDDLEADMNSIEQFMNNKIQQRNTYLQSILQELRSQASDAKTEYDNIKNTFSSILASLPTLPHQNFYMKPIGISKEGYELVDPTNKVDKDKSAIYDAISEAYYIYGDHKSSAKPMFSKTSTDGYLDEKFSINDSDTLETQMQTCINLISFMANVTYGAGTSAVKTIGSQKITIQTLQASISNIATKTLPSISGRLNEIFGIEISQESGACCIDQINTTISFLTNNVSEQNFNDDVVIKKYYDTLRELTSISCDQYLSAKSSYEALWTEFDDFFVDFAKSSNYRMFIPYNLSCIDEYRQKKDAIALANINEQFDVFDGIYQNLQKKFIDMCNDNKIMLYDTDLKQNQYMYSGEALEFCLEDFVDAMIVDIEAREIIANNIATEVYNCIVAPGGIQDQVCDLYKKYFPARLRPYKNNDEYRDKFSAMTMSFLDVMSSIIDKLSFQDTEMYNQFKELFKNYSGVPDIATDPYYNAKNQTHPSYQIHPFMWNFIEYYPVTTAIEMIARQITGIDYSSYESSNIMSTIDGLLGKFGNMIDVWRTNNNDFTGYQTKYEYSNHICSRTGLYSEVVGYEGAFYPPALDAYRKSSLPHGLNKIEKYYAYLKLDSDPDMKNKIDQLLRKRYNDIINYTNDHSKAETYDIYKYYVDQYENMYILYKNYKGYGTDNPTEYQKLMAPGALWVRLADTPIAFLLSDLVDGLPNIEIYDICLIAEGNKIVLTGKFNGNGYIQSQAFYISYKTNNVCGVGKLSLSDKDEGVVENTARFPSDSIASEYKYVGSLNNSQNNITVAYLQDEKISPIAKIFTVAPYRPKVNVTNVELTDISNFIDESPVLAQHTAIERGITQQYVDLLFAMDGDSSKFGTATSYKSLRTDIVSAAAGYTYDDPIHESMNSLDFIDGQLVLKSIRIDDSEIQKTYSISSHSLQTNTDMGYTPSYTYDKYENVLDIRADLCSSYQMVELLGKSKDIEGAISRTNPESDPYITKQDLFDKYMYGRIYEDTDGVQFNGLSDQSINIIENKSLYENMPNEYDWPCVYNYVNGHYQWNIRLNDMYSYQKLRKMRLFIYSTISLGKNPYVVEEMKDVIDKSNELAQNEFLSTNYSASQFDVTTISFINASFTITMNGTQNGINQIDSYFSNKLPNISNFTYKYFKMVDGSMYLKLDFKLDNVNADGYIEEGAIKVAFVDMFDLSFYNWYHYLDPGVTFGDFQYVINRLSGDPLTKAQLMSLDMSKYEYLSDVQVNGLRIFDTNHRIQFKISEEDVFPVSSYNYYVPSLNTKYPMTMAQSFDKQYNIPADLITSQVNIFQPDEIYELEVADASILEMLDTIGMEFTDVDDGFRVFEDYFHVELDDVANSGRFSPDDPRFYQYVHFFAVGDGVDDGENALSVQQSACIDVRVQRFYGDQPDKQLDPFSIELDKLNLWAMHGEQLGSLGQKGTYVRDFNFKKLSPGEKTRIIQEAKKFMRLHFNYAKTKNGIVIYVNYANYINSPYVKLVDGRPYLALVDNTYLRLASGESGLISIVVQFKQLLNGILMAVKNIVVATYKVYNVSDDKPKFVIEKISQLS